MVETSTLVLCAGLTSIGLVIGLAAGLNKHPGGGATIMTGLAAIIAAVIGWVGGEVVKAGEAMIEGVTLLIGAALLTIALGALIGITVGLKLRYDPHLSERILGLPAGTLTKRESKDSDPEDEATFSDWGLEEGMW